MDGMIVSALTIRIDNTLCVRTNSFVFVVRRNSTDLFKDAVIEQRFASLAGFAL
jgi:hypothetical protein